MGKKLKVGDILIGARYKQKFPKEYTVTALGVIVRVMDYAADGLFDSIYVRRLTPCSDSEVLNLKYSFIVKTKYFRKLTKAELILYKLKYETEAE